MLLAGTGTTAIQIVSFGDISNNHESNQMSRRWWLKLYEVPPNIRQLKGTSCVRGTIGVSVPALPEIISFSTRGYSKVTESTFPVFRDMGQTDFLIPVLHPSVPSLVTNHWLH